MTHQDFYSEEAAEYVRRTYGLRCKVGLLQKLACIGGGPVFRKRGRYRVYEQDALDAWARARISPRVSKASELKAHHGKAA